MERIAALEKIKAAAAAAQLAEVVRFTQSQLADQHADGVDYGRLGRGIGDQIGMATKSGPWQGARRLTIARDLWQELPGCFSLLAAGEISEHVAGLLVTETSHLDPETRRAVDAQLVTARVDQLAPRKAAGTARRLAYAADPEGSMRRARIARKDRRISLRPLPDTMAGLSAFLPVEQGVACWAALKARVDALKAAGDSRTRGQIAADTLVERLTGQAAADDVGVEVQITVPVENLLDPDQQQPAEVHGFGPIPAGLADQIIGRTSGSRRWRRLFTAPARDGRGSMIVGGDPAARRFTGWLAKLITLRDRCCREPFCSAPIRHVDHIVPVRDGGPTCYDNGRGVCEHHNYLREMPGWQVTTVSQPGEPHTTITTTPTGHHYLSRAPKPP
ncbi:MAG TPA: DUF222 domain-containing protein [Propionibacteriaceae bacterium]|nr:DUF222 domain-containing protein [Propionibacteriaceae bacterium]